MAGPGEMATPLDQQILFSLEVKRDFRYFVVPHDSSDFFQIQRVDDLEEAGFLG